MKNNLAALLFFKCGIVIPRQELWYISDGDCACYEIFCVQHFVHLFAMLANMYVFIQHTMKTVKKKKKDEFKIWDSTLKGINVLLK